MFYPERGKPIKSLCEVTDKADPIATCRAKPTRTIRQSTRRCRSLSAQARSGKATTPTVECQPVSTHALAAW